ncbi:TetR/AcrR family transcriptional regulator [Cryobacterium sp. PH31-L1]|uniref:TetR/AcrR family transcriptional regulator n=1 Tax=Cryobacterium sp. PH31-L1 TaxID=3046199 RepID=UPI0024B8B2B3|nr:TetR/AcrR family transcriptional regulator [Cryobacterium sp. PH31-L1]MDJ0375929.1 TetR family transcriptional regulator C-terminal domain-containing protein [Cryobacterium sp. PH31-L1]
MESQEEGAVQAEYRAALLVRVRTAIRNSGLAQRDVARHIGLDETKLSKALKGTRRFRPDELTQLATAAGVSVNWLLSGTDDGMGVSAIPAATILPTRHSEDSDHAQKRRTIVEQAWWLFAERGYSSVRISDIAAASGTSDSTVHYYFRTKREIFAEALRYSVKLAFDRQIAELHLYPNPVDRLKRLAFLQLPAGVRGRAEMSIWLQIWAEAAVDPAWQEGHAQSYRRWSQTVHDIIVDGQHSGCVIAVDADELTQHLTALIDGLIIKVLTGMLTSDQMYEQIEKFIDRTVVTPAS